MELKIWKLISPIYVVSFIVGIPWYFVFSKYHQIISNNGLNNFLNNFFVTDFGYVWFTVVYFVVGALYPYVTGRAGKDQVFSALKVYAINTAFFIMSNVWFVGPSLFERLDVIEGGHCVNIITERAEPTISRDPCEASDKLAWVYGFDASSHFYLISSMSLLVWDQLIRNRIVGYKRSREIVDLEQQVFEVTRAVQKPATRLSTTQLQIVDFLVKWGSITLLLIWYIEFSVTSLFFHTVLEKIIGLMCGYMVPVLTHVYYQSI